MIFLAAAFTLITSLPPAQTGKDEFVFNNSAEIESLDPQFLTGVPDNNIAVQIFEGLMTRKQDWLTLTNGQAESYKLSKDGKTYTFKLRPNLKWSDGSDLTAKDFEYSWLRAIHPKTMAGYVSWLTDNVVGAAEYNKAPTDANAAKVAAKALDARTFEVKLLKAVPHFIQFTAEAITYPVKKSVVEKFKDQWTRPENIVSNGAYKIVEWKVQDKIVLEKNPNYYDAANVKLSKVVAYPIVDRQTSVNLFKQGKLDWSGHNGAPNSLVPAFKSDPNFRMNPGFISYFYRINTTRKPFDDKRVRQALSLAVDRKMLVESVTRGGEIPAGFLVPQKIGTYKSPTNFISADHKANVEKAKKLLAEAGFPGGKGMKAVEILYNQDENHKKIALTIQQMWKKELGVDAKLNNQEWKVYLKNQVAKDFDFSRSGWQGDYPDPMNFLELFVSTSGNSHTGWKNPQYDKLIADAASTADEKKRNKLLSEAEALLIDEMVIMPLYIYTNFSFVRPEIVGFEPNLVDRPYVRYLKKS